MKRILSFLTVALLGPIWRMPAWAEEPRAFAARHAYFSRIAAQAREIAGDSWGEVRKRFPKALGKAAANALVAGPALALGLWAGHNGLRMLLDAAGAIAAINGAVGHPGGAFDRLLKTVERVGVRSPQPGPERDPRARNNRRSERRKRGGAGNGLL
jgi:hypothetical protein